MAYRHMAGPQPTEQGLSITDTTESPSPLREQDMAIIDFFQDCLSDPHTLQRLNHCRLYLKLFGLSEVLSYHTRGSN